MKIITWEWRGQVMVDYFIFPWLQITGHFKGVRHWSWTFWWKGSNVWYYNFHRKVADRVYYFQTTKLTLRLGKYIIVFGGVDLNKYYRTVKVLQVKDKGKIVFPISGRSLEAIIKSVKEKLKAYKYLSQEYPDHTWRN